MYACVYIYNSCLYTYFNVRDTYILTNLCVYIYMYTYMYVLHTHARARAHTHTHTHTHTQTVIGS